MSSADVAVIGAGPAGLMAALHPARAGRSVVVHEAADRVVVFGRQGLFVPDNTHHALKAFSQHAVED